MQLTQSQSQVDTEVCAMLAPLGVLYPDFSPDEHRLLAQAAFRAGLNPYKEPREITLMRNAEGQPFVFENTITLLADAERYFASRGAALWWDTPTLVIDPERRAALGCKPGRATLGKRRPVEDLLVEVTLFDNKARNSFCQAFAQMGGANLRREARQLLLDALGPIPPTGCTKGIGIVWSAEHFDARFRMTHMDYAGQRARRCAIVRRIPTLGAHRLTALRAPLVDPTDENARAVARECEHQGA